MLGRSNCSEYTSKNNFPISIEHWRLRNDNKKGAFGFTERPFFIIERACLKIMV